MAGSMRSLRSPLRRASVRSSSAAWPAGYNRRHPQPGSPRAFGSRSLRPSWGATLAQTPAPVCRFLGAKDRLYAAFLPYRLPSEKGSKGSRAVGRWGDLRSSQRREAVCRVREDKYLLRAIAVILRSVFSETLLVRPGEQAVADDIRYQDRRALAALAHPSGAPALRRFLHHPLAPLQENRIVALGAVSIAPEGEPGIEGKPGLNFGPRFIEPAEGSLASRWREWGLLRALREWPLVAPCRLPTRAKVPRRAKDCDPLRGGPTVWAVAGVHDLDHNGSRPATSRGSPLSSRGS